MANDFILNQYKYRLSNQMKDSNAINFWAENQGDKLSVRADDFFMRIFRGNWDFFPKEFNELDPSKKDFAIKILLNIQDTDTNGQISTFECSDFFNKMKLDSNFS